MSDCVILVFAKTLLVMCALLYCVVRIIIIIISTNMEDLEYDIQTHKSTQLTCYMMSYVCTFCLSLRMMLTLPWGRALMKSMACFLL